MVDRTRKTYKVASYSGNWFPCKFHKWRDYDTHLLSFEMFHRCFIITWELTFGISEEEIN